MTTPAVAGPVLPKLPTTSDNKRLADYRANLAFYNGTQWAGRRPGDRSKRLTFNYARAFIDKISGYVTQGTLLAVLPPSDADAARSAAQAAEEALRQVAEDNSLTRLDFDTEIDTAVLGDGAFKLTWANERVHITAPDMQTIFVWTDPADLTKPVRVAHRYKLGSGPTITEDWTDTTVEIWADQALVSSDPNPYGFIPFVIFPNVPVPKQWWGLSDITPIKELAQELNASITRLSAILEVSGNPIAVLQGVEQAEDIAVGPGAVWEIPADAKAYLLDLLQGGGVRLHIDYIDALYRILHDLSEVPRAAFAGIDKQLSGVALEIELRPLIMKVERKRLIRHAAYAQRARMALALLDQNTGTNHTNAGRVAVIGAEPVLPPDKSMDAGRETAIVAAGLSSRVASMGRLGADDPTAEFDRIKQESRELAEIGSTTPAPPQT